MRDSGESLKYQEFLLEDNLFLFASFAIKKRETTEC